MFSLPALRGGKAPCGSSNIAKPFQKMFGVGAAETIAGSLVKRFGESRAIQLMQRLSQTAAGRIALSAIGEGGEEVVEAVLQPFLKRATYDPEARFDGAEAWNSALVGGILGGLGGNVDVADAFLEGFLDGDTEPVQAGRGTAAKGPYPGEALALPQGGVVTGLADSGGGRLALEGGGGLPGVVDFGELYAAALQNGFVQPGTMRDWRAALGLPALRLENLQDLYGAQPTVPLLPERSVFGIETAQGVQEIGADRPLNILEQTVQQPYGPEGSVVPETDHTLLQALLDDETLQGGVSKTWAKLLEIRANRAILKEKISSGEISTKISFQQQRKHIDGTPQFKQYLSSRIAKGGTPQSILTLSQEDAQDIIDRFSGTGVVKIIKTGEHSVKITEYVTTDRVVGLFFENNQFKETRRVCILYGKNGVHVVPTKEDYHG